MNIRQLRYLTSIAEHGFNISRAAAALHTSQPGISKQIKTLEQELGVDILVRKGNRIGGITDPGKAILRIAQRMLNDMHNLHRIGREFGMHDSGRLVVGTTHTHARYMLPHVIRRFMKRYPRVELVIQQDNENRIADLVSAGEIDIGVTAQPPAAHEDLLIFPCYRLSRSVITQPRHPLLTKRQLTLKDIARYPIITLDPSFAGGRKVLDAFIAAGLSPKIVMRAIDADVIKSYVELGLGVAILPTIAFVPDRDRQLRAREAKQLFEPTISCVQIRWNHYYLQYMLDFIQLVAPQWTQRMLTRTLSTGQVPVRPVAEFLRDNGEDTQNT